MARSTAADLVEIAAGLGVPVRDIVDAQWADNGPGWVAVLLRDAQAVLDLEVGPMGRFNHIGVVGAYPPGGSVADYEIRAFTGLIPSGEDPVTGSLNASVAQWLIGANYAPASYVASQGTRMHRRGRIYIDQSDEIWVGGDTVVGVAGTVNL